MSSAPQTPKINWLFCIGDSLTNTDTTLYIPKKQQYPKVLQQLIGGNCRERNLGVPGNTTTQALARINYDILRIYTPTVATIYLGINDCLQSIATSTTQSNLQTIITDLQNAGCNKIVICNIHHAQTATDYSAYRTTLQNLATSNNLPFCDFYANAGLVSADFQADNLHLQPSGLQKLANTLKATLDAQGWTTVLQN